MILPKRSLMPASGAQLITQELTRAFKSKALDTDNAFAFAFTQPGNYAYVCSLPPHMTGTIAVEPATRAAN
jgi:plastocyanin